MKKTTNKNLRNVLSFIICLALVMSYVPMTALAAEGISYIDEKGEEQTYTGEYTEITAESGVLEAGWYVVSSDVTVKKNSEFNGSLRASGDVHLILCDGATLTLTAGFIVSMDNSLTIYGQKDCTGILTTTGYNGYSYGGAGIGDVRTGTITINGGVINARGATGSSNGTGGSSGAGIGASYKLTINSSPSSDFGYSGTIVINGGIVNATAGKGGAGIGLSSTSRYTGGGTITITGGVVNATGGEMGAGIGGGTYSGGHKITITGGIITATGGKYAPGIGTGDDDAATVVITGGNIKAVPGEYSVAIGEGATTVKNSNGDNITLKTLDFGTEKVALTRINGLPGYYDITETETIGGKYYIYVASNVELGNAYAGDVLYERTENGYVHSHNFIGGICACEEYTPATEVSDKYDVDGDGYTDQVYEIANAGQLYWFAGLVNGTLADVQQNKRANAVLTADIVVNKNVLNDDYSLNGDGSSFREWSVIDLYSGIFDGAGHYISGVYFNNNAKYAGFFESMYGTVKNLGIIDSYFYVSDEYETVVGTICAVTGSGSVITDCYVQANVCTPRGKAGGFVGYGQMSDRKVIEITNCYFIGVVNEDDTEFGPFIGNEHAEFTNCYYDNALYTGTVTKGEIGATAEQFASGEIAYLLNNSSPDGIWRQTIGEDGYPNFNGKKVYYGYSCKTEKFVGYTNENAHPTQPHYDENGYCKYCYYYEPATLNEDGYYEIYNAGHLYWFADKVSSFNNGWGAVHNAILMNDIVINENLVDENGNLTENTDNLREWRPIGNGSYTTFNGVFDGNYHTISGIYIDDVNANCSALFGSISNGMVKNLGITDSYINGKRSAAFAGVLNGTIENCFVTDTVIKGESADSFAAIYNGTTSNYDYPCFTKNSYSTALVYENGTKVDSAYVSNYISENLYYLADSDNGNGGKTAEQFANGEVAYLLNGATSAGTLIWGQTIGTDAYPVWNGATVYCGFDCGGTDECYSNTELLDADDSYHIPSNWWNVDYEDAHRRFICTREGCSQYQVYEYENCHGGTATCTNYASCVVCYYPYGDFDANNHSSDKTYLTEGDENGHKLFHTCCETEISTTPHSYEGYDFDTDHHWHACECGYVQGVVKEAHTFDGNGFCTVCDGYEPAPIVYNEESYSNVAEISNAGQLFWYAKNWMSCQVYDEEYDEYYTTFVGAVLINDIDLNPGYTFNDDGSYSTDSTAENYSPVLREWKPIKDFAWVDFDGQNHTVNGLYINAPNEDDVGMFERNDYYTIKNITLTNGFVYGGNNTAALVGYNTGSVENCHSDISVKGKGSIGGIIAYQSGGEVKNCSNTGSVIIYGASSAMGGIVGNVYGGTTITNCYNTGYIKGGINVGGIVGDAGNSTISNCYNTGIVLSNFSDAHAISGGGTIENCYELDIVDDGAEKKTKAQFASGEVAYLLQANQPVQEIYDDDWNVIGEEQEAVWFQTIGEDALPTFDNTSLIVYKNIIGGCREANRVYEYSNTEKEPVIAHVYINGFCTGCDDNQPAEYNETDDSYEIANAGQLYWFAEKVNGGEYTLNAKLVADVTDNEVVLNENGNLVENADELRQWVPMGSSENAYNGTFDGNSNTISGLFADLRYMGLFSQVGENGIVKNVGIIGSMFKGSSEIGGIAGVNYGTIEGCYFSGKIVARNEAIGGLVGENYGTVTNCFSLAYVQGSNSVGGVVGYSKQASVSNCYHSGSVFGNNYFGAVIGSSTYTTVSHCYYNTTKTLSTIQAIGRNNNSTVVSVEGKSSEQFASGEVAYLLQQGNTEQVWGQDSNQAGASPIFDSRGLYKVVTVGETGNYSVANVGDINGDGTVDVVDYQALVNKALADDHEQIETANYDDIVRYDIDGDGYLDVIDASLMNLLINGHRTIDVYAVGDYDLNGKAFEEADILAMGEAIQNNKPLSTYQKYACDMNADGKVDYDDLNTLTSMFPLYFVGEE